MENLVDSAAVPMGAGLAGEKERGFAEVVAAGCRTGQTCSNRRTRKGTLPKRGREEREGARYVEEREEEKRARRQRWMIKGAGPPFVSSGIGNWLMAFMMF